MLGLTDGSHVTLDEYLEKAKGKHENTVYYATDKTVQAQYISLFNARGIDVAMFDKVFETSFMSMLEEDRKLKFVRVDADIEALKGDGEIYENEELVKLFKEISKNESLEVKFEALADENTPALLNISEQSRRMEDMMKMYSRNGMPNMAMPTEATLILNTGSNLIKKLGENVADKKTKIIAHQVYMLALITQRQLSAEELKEFLSDSFKLLEENI